MDNASNSGRQTGTESLPKQSFLAELFDAVSLRTFLLVVGVLFIQLGFVLSYVGAFHDPTPYRIPVTVEAPAQVSGLVVHELNSIHGQPLDATTVNDTAVGRSLLQHGLTDGVFIVRPTSRTDDLLVASAEGAAIAAAIEDIVTKVEASQHRQAIVMDIVPAQPGDARGLSGFYLVVGWLVGGYLVAALLGIAKGSRTATTRRAIIRLMSIVPYAILSGLGGAIIVDPVLGALNGHFVALWWLGALLVYCAAAVTMAFQVLLGVLGIGLTVILFVVLGNPSAGGAYPPPLLPPFWRAISSGLPNGAGVDALRRIVYFNSYRIGGDLLVIAIYTAAGIAVVIVSATFIARRSSAGAAVAAVV